MTFYYHYSKPASKKFKIPKLSLHFNGACHLVNSIACKVPTFTKNNKRQPLIVVKGYANKIKIVDKIAIIA